MNYQIVTPYRVSHLQRYGFTVRCKVTSVYPPIRLECLVACTVCVVMTCKVITDREYGQLNLTINHCVTFFFKICDTTAQF
jgi:hypothetical protein